MRGFLFQTVPDFSLRTHTTWMMVLCALLIFTSAVVLALTPGFDPVLRMGIGYGVWWVTGFVVVVLCRMRARARGVIFIADQEAATRIFRWNMTQPLDLYFLHFTFVLALVLLGILPLLHGVQIWQFDSFDWGMFLLLLSAVVPIGLLAKLMFKEIKTPPRIGRWWTLIIGAALYVWLYIDGTSLPPHRPLNEPLRTLIWVGAALWIATAIVLALRTLRRKSS
jgi:hypothetical protein